MTTPEEAKRFAEVLWNQRVGIDITDCITDLANQVERLEAQRKELRETCEFALEALEALIKNDSGIKDHVRAALKATE